MAILATTLQQISDIRADLAKQQANITQVKQTLINPIKVSLSPSQLKILTRKEKEVMKGRTILAEKQRRKDLSKLKVEEAKFKTDSAKIESQLQVTESQLSSVSSGASKSEREKAWDIAQKLYVKAHRGKGVNPNLQHQTPLVQEFYMNIQNQRPHIEQAGVSVSEDTYNKLKIQLEGYRNLAESAAARGEVLSAGDEKRRADIDKALSQIGEVFTRPKSDKVFTTERTLQHLQERAEREPELRDIIRRLGHDKNLYDNYPKGEASNTFYNKIAKAINKVIPREEGKEVTGMDVSNYMKRFDQQEIQAFKAIPTSLGYIHKGIQIFNPITVLGRGLQSGAGGKVVKIAKVAGDYTPVNFVTGPGFKMYEETEKRAARLLGHEPSSSIARKTFELSGKAAAAVGAYTPITFMTGPGVKIYKETERRAEETLGHTPSSTIAKETFKLSGKSADLVGTYSPMNILFGEPGLKIYKETESRAERVFGHTPSSTIAKKAFELSGKAAVAVGAYSPANLVFGRPGLTAAKLALPKKLPKAIKIADTLGKYTPISILSERIETVGRATAMALPKKLPKAIKVGETLGRYTPVSFLVSNAGLAATSAKLALPKLIPRVPKAIIIADTLGKYTPISILGDNIGTAGRAAYTSAKLALPDKLPKAIKVAETLGRYTPVSMFSENIGRATVTAAKLALPKKLPKAIKVAGALGRYTPISFLSENLETVGKETTKLAVLALPKKLPKAIKVASAIGKYTPISVLGENIGTVGGAAITAGKMALPKKVPRHVELITKGAIVVGKKVLPKEVPEHVKIISKGAIKQGEASAEALAIAGQFGPVNLTKSVWDYQAGKAETAFNREKTYVEGQNYLYTGMQNVQSQEDLDNLIYTARQKYGLTLIPFEEDGKTTFEIKETRRGHELYKDIRKDFKVKEGKVIEKIKESTLGYTIRTTSKEAEEAVAKTAEVVIYDRNPFEVAKWDTKLHGLSKGIGKGTVIGAQIGTAMAFPHTAGPLIFMGPTVEMLATRPKEFITYAKQEPLEVGIAAAYGTIGALKFLRKPIEVLRIKPKPLNQLAYTRNVRSPTFTVTVPGTAHKASFKITASDYIKRMGHSAGKTIQQPRWQTWFKIKPQASGKIGSMLWGKTTIKTIPKKELFLTTGGASRVTQKAYVLDVKTGRVVKTDLGLKDTTLAKAVRGQQRTTGIRFARESIISKGGLQQPAPVAIYKSGSRVVDVWTVGGHGQPITSATFNNLSKVTQRDLLRTAKMFGLSKKASTKDLVKWLSNTKKGKEVMRGFVTAQRMRSLSIPSFKKGGKITELAFGKVTGGPPRQMTIPGTGGTINLPGKSLLYKGGKLYDITGGGKKLVKASEGIYDDILRGAKISRYKEGLAKGSIAKESYDDILKQLKVKKYSVSRPGGLEYQAITKHTVTPGAKFTSPHILTPRETLMYNKAQINQVYDDFLKAAKISKHKGQITKETYDDILKSLKIKKHAVSLSEQQKYVSITDTRLLDRLYDDVLKGAKISKHKGEIIKSTYDDVVGELRRGHIATQSSDDILRELKIPKVSGKITTYDDILKDLKIQKIKGTSLSSEKGVRFHISGKTIDLPGTKVPLPSGPTPKWDVSISTVTKGKGGKLIKDGGVFLADDALTIDGKPATVFWGKIKTRPWKRVPNKMIRGDVFGIVEERPFSPLIFQDRYTDVARFKGIQTYKSLGGRKLTKTYEKSIITAGDDVGLKPFKEAPSAKKTGYHIIKGKQVPIKKVKMTKLRAQQIYDKTGLGKKAVKDVYVYKPNEKQWGMEIEKAIKAAVRKKGVGGKYAIELQKQLKESEQIRKIMLGTVKEPGKHGKFTLKQVVKVNGKWKYTTDAIKTKSLKSAVQNYGNQFAYLDKGAKGEVGWYFKKAIPDSAPRYVGGQGGYDGSSSLYGGGGPYSNPDYTYFVDKIIGPKGPVDDATKVIEKSQVLEPLKPRGGPGGPSPPGGGGGGFPFDDAYDDILGELGIKKYPVSLSPEAYTKLRTMTPSQIRGLSKEYDDVLKNLKIDKLTGRPTTTKLVFSTNLRQPLMPVFDMRIPSMAIKQTPQLATVLPPASLWRQDLELKSDLQLTSQSLFQTVVHDVALDLPMPPQQLTKQGQKSVQDYVTPTPIPDPTPPIPDPIPPFPTPTPRPRPPRGGEINIPPILPPFWLFKERTKGKRIEKEKEKPREGYNVLVKPLKQKRFVRANVNPITKKKAMDLGANITDTTLGATWKISKAGKPAKKPKLKVPKGYYQKTKSKYRDYIIKKGKKKYLVNKWIEKKNKRLDTLGEVGKVQVLAKIAKMKTAKTPFSVSASTKSKSILGL